MAGPGASGPAGRARCPNPIIGLAADVVESKDEKTGMQKAQRAISALETAFTQKTFLTGLEELGGVLKDPLRFGAR